MTLIVQELWLYQKLIEKSSGTAALVLEVSTVTSTKIPAE